MGNQRLSLIMIALMIALLTLVVAGIIVFVLKGRRRATHPACGGCGYDVSGGHPDGDHLILARCPECGADLRTVGITPPGRIKSKKPLVIAIACFLLAAVGLQMLTFSFRNRAAQAQRAAVQAQQAAVQAQLNQLNLTVESVVEGATERAIDQATEVIDAVTTELVPEDDGD